MHKILTLRRLFLLFLISFIPIFTIIYTAPINLFGLLVITYPIYCIVILGLSVRYFYGTRYTKCKKLGAILVSIYFIVFLFIPSGLLASIGGLAAIHGNDGEFGVILLLIFFLFALISFLFPIFCYWHLQKRIDICTSRCENAENN